MRLFSLLRDSAAQHWLTIFWFIINHSHLHNDITKTSRLRVTSYHKTCHTSAFSPDRQGYFRSCWSWWFSWWTIGRSAVNAERPEVTSVPSSIKLEWGAPSTTSQCQIGSNVTDQELFRREPWEKLSVLPEETSYWNSWLPWIYEENEKLKMFLLHQQLCLLIS